MRRVTSFLPAAIMTLMAVGAAAQDSSKRVIPIPQQPFAQPVPEFIGSPAIPKPIRARPVPEDPFMAPNGQSSLHLDVYQSDTYPTAGPLGHSPEVNSTFLAGICGTVTGLEYTYSKDPSPADAPLTDPWYFTAVAFHTARNGFKVLVGTGILYNSHYSSAYVSPDGKTAYVGVLGGLVRIHDTY